MPLPLILVLALIAGPALAEPKPPKKAAASNGAEPTWDKLVDHVLAQGKDKPIKAPTSRTLGYDADDVNAKVMRVKAEKSKDGREHTVYVVTEPAELVVGSIRVVEKGKDKVIDSYRVRMTRAGKVLSAMRADGIVGEVKQRALGAGDKETAALLKAEKKYFLKETELSQLTQ